MKQDKPISTSPQENIRRPYPSTQKALERWLMSRVDQNGILNLVYNPYMPYPEDFPSDYDPYYFYTSDAYAFYVRLFMADPNAFLNKHPEIICLNLGGHKWHWDLATGLRLLAQNQTLERLYLDRNGI